MDRTVSTYEAKAKLSDILRRVEAGDEVIITRHDKPIARIVAIRADEDDIDARIDRLRRAGRIVAATSRGAWGRMPAGTPARGALARFLADRE